MYVETWLDFFAVIEAIFPSLYEKDKKIAAQVYKWAEDGNYLNSGYDPAERDQIVNWLITSVIPILAGQAQDDVVQAKEFLKALNETWEAGYWKTIAGCSFWGYYWYNAACHEFSHDLPYYEYVTAATCQDAGYYWYGGECHDEPPVIEPPDLLDPDEIHNSGICLNQGYYWYDDACHEYPEFPPPIVDEDRACEEWRNRSKCLKMGCYWHKHRCYESVADVIEGDIDELILNYAFDYTVEMAKKLAGKAQAKLDYWMSIEGYPYFWADWMSWTDAFEDEINLSLMGVTYDMMALSDWIGDIWALDGKNIVEAILSIESGGETIGKTLIENLLRDLEYSWSDYDGKVYRITGGFIDKVSDLLDFVTDKEGNLILPTLDAVRDMLEDDYQLTTQTIENISEPLNYAYDQVKGVETDTGSTLRVVIKNLLVAVSGIIEVVSGEIEREAFPLDAHPLDWMPASFGWVKEKLTAVGNIIFDCIEETTLALAEQINKIGTIVVSMPDWWIEDLKERLGI